VDVNCGAQYIQLRGKYVTHVQMQAHETCNVEFNIKQTRCGGVNWIALCLGSTVAFCGDRDEHCSSMQQQKFLGNLGR
jgi:hypothetical protein